MRRCLKEPIPEVFAAWENLCRAVDAQLAGDVALASALFRDANCPIVWEWLNGSWVNVVQHVLVPRPATDTKQVPLSARDPDRNIGSHVKKAVLARDGYRCRYCGLPVVHADIRKIAHMLHPEAVPWNTRDARQQHAGFQALWLQFDHVEPHSHGGQSSVENVVVTCALCNFGKDRHTLRQLDIEDPRLRPPVPSAFDGLERLRLLAPPVRRAVGTGLSVRDVPTDARPDADTAAFFFPGGWISKGYANIPPINGKNRWFKIGGNVKAEAVTRNGVAGCLVVCPPKLVARRGLDANAFQDGGIKE